MGFSQSLDLVPDWSSSGGCELWGSFVPRGAGLAALAVTYQGHHIKGSPWQVCCAQLPQFLSSFTASMLPWLLDTR